MTHSSLINWALGTHGTVFIIALTSFFKYADRTTMFERSFKISMDTIQRIKERIYGELSITLRPLFDQPQGEAIKILEILRPDGEAWTEETVGVSPQETEDYKNAIYGLIKNYTMAMGDYRIVKTTIDRCKFWAGYLSWSILSVLIMQGLALIHCGIIDKAFCLCSKDFPVYAFMLVTVCLIINCFFSLPLLLFYHGRIDKYGREYN